MTEEDKSKDRFFERLGELAEEMIAAHGKDFATGTLILAARFIVEGKPLVKKAQTCASQYDTCVAPECPRMRHFICFNFWVQQDFIVFLAIIGWHVDCY